MTTRLAARANGFPESLVSPLQLALVVALHLAVLGAVVANDAVARRPRQDALLVRMIAREPLPVAPAPAPRHKPAPRPSAAPRSVATTQPPLLGAPSSAATLLSAPAEPTQAVAEPSAALSAAPATAAAAPAAAPAALVGARFDADYLDNPAPAYPPMSRRLGEEGRVVVRVFVQADGKPTNVEIRTGSGSPRLDQAALDAVRHWKFVPARRGDEPVAAWVLVPVAFHLKG